MGMSGARAGGILLLDGTSFMALSLDGTSREVNFAGC